MYQTYKQERYLWKKPGTQYITSFSYKWHIYLFLNTFKIKKNENSMQTYLLFCFQELEMMKQNQMEKILHKFLK